MVLQKDFKCRSYRRKPNKLTSNIFTSYFFLIIKLCNRTPIKFLKNLMIPLLHMMMPSAELWPALAWRSAGLRIAPPFPQTPPGRRAVVVVAGCKEGWLQTSHTPPTTSAHCCCVTVVLFSTQQPLSCALKATICEMILFQIYLDKSVTS